MITVHRAILHRKEATNLMIARHSKCPNMDLAHVITEETNRLICKLCTTLMRVVHLCEGIITVLVRLVHRVVFTRYFSINECMITLCIPGVVSWSNIGADELLSVTCLCLPALELLIGHVL